MAGFWYLLLIVIGPLRLIYIPSKLFVPGNATATVNNIAAHEWLFRFGIVGDLVCAVVLIFLVLAFYRLFKGVDRNLAALVVILGGVMPALINFVERRERRWRPDGRARRPDSLSVFDKPQRDALVMLSSSCTTIRNHCRRDPVGGMASSRWRSLCTGRGSCRGFLASGSSSTASPT